MFGADAVERRYGRQIPDEWNGALCRLNDYQLGQGMRRLLYSGKSAVPSLPEFVKLCRTVGHTDDIADEAQSSTVPALTSDEGQFDNWAVAGNQHLLAHILRNLAKKRCFDERETRILVRFKNLWADQMRLSAGPEGVAPDEQREVWAECVKRAEAEIAQ